MKPKPTMGTAQARAWRRSCRPVGSTTALDEDGAEEGDERRQAGTAADEQKQSETVTVRSFDDSSSDEDESEAAAAAKPAPSWKILLM